MHGCKQFSQVFCLPFHSQICKALASSLWLYLLWPLQHRASCGKLKGKQAPGRPVMKSEWPLMTEHLCTSHKKWKVLPTDKVQRPRPLLDVSEHAHFLGFTWLFIFLVWKTCKSIWKNSKVNFYILKNWQIIDSTVPSILFIPSFHY